MSGTVSVQVQKIESSVAEALGGAGNGADVVRREIESGVAPASVALGALSGHYAYVKEALGGKRSGRLTQTETFRLVDHWGRLTALSNLLAEIETVAESDGEVARARREVFWRGVVDCSLNLARDTAVFIGFAGCAPLVDAILGLARSEADSLQGAIHRMVTRE
jgi:hypothetical protein